MNHPDRKVHSSLLDALTEFKKIKEDVRVHIHQEYTDEKGYSRNILINMVKDFLETNDDWMVMFQDDVILGKNFFPALDYILEKGVFENILQFFSARKEIREKPNGIHRVKNTNLGYMYSTVFSRWFCEQMIKLNDGIHRPIGDDEFIKEMRKLLKLHYLVTRPSFVQHDKEVPSVLGHNFPSTHWIIRSSKTFDPTIDLLEMVKGWSW